METIRIFLQEENQRIEEELLKMNRVELKMASSIMSKWMFLRNDQSQLLLQVVLKYFCFFNLKFPSIDTKYAKQVEIGPKSDIRANALVATNIKRLNSLPPYDHVGSSVKESFDLFNFERFEKTILKLKKEERNVNGRRNYFKNLSVQDGFQFVMIICYYEY